MSAESLSPKKYFKDVDLHMLLLQLHTMFDALKRCIKLLINEQYWKKSHLHLIKGTFPIMSSLYMKRNKFFLVHSKYSSFNFSLLKSYNAVEYILL